MSERIEIPKNITYCTHSSCPRDCERCINNHSFKNQLLQMSNYGDVCGKGYEEECEYYIPVDLDEKSYDVWENFEFRPPTYLDGHFEPNIYDLVKWNEHEPVEVIDWKTGTKKISTRNCFVIARLIWNKKECSLDFESCGLRYLEERVDGLEKFILDFSNKVYQQRKDEDF